MDSPKRKIHTVKIPHLPIHDVIRADDVQNLRAFGTTQAATVMDKVNEKLAGGKSDLEYTREHLAFTVDKNINAVSVTELLDVACLEHGGRPRVIRMDNGPEF
ncbi:major capsid protein, partial [Neisseria mucosa]|nr:major capsid protein [Neisseria mucosa]